MNLDTNTHFDLIKALHDTGRSELATLFVAENENLLESNISALKEEHPEDVVIGIIWCYAQAGLSSIPISFIAGNLLDRHITESNLNSCFNLILTASHLVGTKLCSENEDRLNILLFLPIFDFAVSNAKLLNSDIVKIFQESLSKELELSITRK
ncbi:MAG: hypothetical protein KC414_08355 [Romboutsia sp.]|nr:hypothetical protein [Romboutsia sp.]